MFQVSNNRKFFLVVAMFMQVGVTTALGLWGLATPAVVIGAATTIEFVTVFAPDMEL